jgi:cell division septation protein DedD
MEMDDGDLRPDREITLGTTMILGIFFAIAVLCAGFFGFGYQLGHRSSVVPPPVAAAATDSGNNFSGFKPPAGSPLETAGNKPAAAATPGPAVTVDVPSPAADPPPESLQREPAANIGVPVPSATARPTPATAAPSTIATVLPAASPGALVQIAAVSHKEDADLLVTELKRRGYNVAIRSEAQDKLFHVQIGPLPTHKDADAMRQRLLNDGFNAIVKDNK